MQFEILYVTIDTLIFMKEIEEYTKIPTVFKDPENLFVGGAVFSGYISSGELGIESFPFVGCISGMKFLYDKIGWSESILVDPINLFYIKSKVRH